MSTRHSRHNTGGLTEEVVLIPVVRPVVLSHLANLEPLGSGVVELIAGRRAARRHVVEQRPQLVRPLEGMSATRCTKPLAVTHILGDPAPRHGKRAAGVRVDDHSRLLRVHAAGQVLWVRVEFDRVDAVHEPNRTVLCRPRDERCYARGSNTAYL